MNLQVCRNYCDHSTVYVTKKLNLYKYFMLYNFNADVRQSLFRAKFITEEKALMLNLGVSYKNMNLFYTTILLWSNCTGQFY
jgi:hypothetical protein